jgi:hypothetical protein
VLGVASCHATQATTTDEAAAPQEVTPPTVRVGAVEVEPPTPVVAEDPQILLHEAVVGSVPVGPDFFADTAPPALVVEDTPARLAPEQVWVPGYWWWSRPLARYIWVTGAWRNPPPDQVWSPGSWVVGDPGRYVWSPGVWAPRDFVRDAAVADSAPPVLRVEAFGARPDPSFAWTPGYYAHREGAYVWVPGSWSRPPLPGLGWVEPRYVGFGKRFFFQPGRWDFAPALRGTAYAPDVKVHAGAHLTPTPVPAAVVGAHARFVSALARSVGQGLAPRVVQARDSGARRP